MNYKAFVNYMVTVTNAIDSGYNHHPEKEETIFRNNGKWALTHLEKEFDDKQKNIRRWLNSKPCRFFCKRTQKPEEVKIGDSYEPLYYFLIYCKETQAGREVSDEFCEYMRHVITVSLCGETN